MRKGFVTAFAAVVLSVASGCAPSPPAVVQVSLTYPGANAKVMDELACAPIWQGMLGAESVLHSVWITSNGHAEIYFEGKPGVSASDFLHVVKGRVESRRSLLPAACGWRIVDATGSPIPADPPIRMVDTVNANIDRDKMHALGLSTEETMQALSQRNAESLGQLKKQKIKSPNGAKVPLESFVEFTTTQEPDHILRHGPPPAEKPKSPK